MPSGEWACPEVSFFHAYFVALFGGLIRFFFALWGERRDDRLSGYGLLPRIPFARGIEAPVVPRVRALARGAFVWANGESRKHPSRSLLSQFVREENVAFGQDDRLRINQKPEQIDHTRASNQAQGVNYMEGNSLPIWHRCGTCGTIVGDLQELRLHLKKHTASKRRTSPLYPQSPSNLRNIAERKRKVHPEQRKIGDVS